MERPTTTKLRIGDWYIRAASGEISRNGETVRVDGRTMRVLLCLAEHPGEVMSIDDLLDQVWSDVSVAPDSVYQAVTSLRRLLGDDPKQPKYIATVPRLGYRMVAMVRPWSEPTLDPASLETNGQVGDQPSASRISVSEPPTTATSEASIASKTGAAVTAGTRNAAGLHIRSRFLWAVYFALGLALVVIFLSRGKFGENSRSTLAAVSAQPEKSIAVLPFLDLTDEMNEEPFADGMTEELIDKLSKIPSLRVPPPTSSFYFKSKLWPRSNGTSQSTIPEIAKALGVAYVLDGSVRKSANRLRIDARLIRAESGYVVWSETYDRPLNDLLMVQDDIAGEVAKAMRASIGDHGSLEKKQ
jgi:TolB-like protein/DNA-binding winged helix-turn-helix (wHTH) protein